MVSLPPFLRFLSASFILSLLLGNRQGPVLCVQKLAIGQIGRSTVEVSSEHEARGSQILLKFHNVWLFSRKKFIADVDITRLHDKSGLLDFLLVLELLQWVIGHREVDGHEVL